MGLDVAVGSFNIGTSGVGTTKTIVPGFEAKALILWWSGRTEDSDTAGSQTIKRGIGFATSSTNRINQYSSARNNAADSYTQTSIQYDEIYVNMNTTNDTIQGSADFSGFQSSGFTLDMDDADPSESFVWYIAFSGTGASPQTLTAGSQTTTTTNPTAITVANVDVSTGIQQVAITNPVAALEALVTLGAGLNEVTFTNPTVILLPGNVNILAGIQEVPITAPTAVLVIEGIVPQVLNAGILELLFTNPISDLIPGAVTVPSGIQTLSFTNPVSVLIAERELPAGLNEIIMTAPDITLIPGDVSILGNEQQIMIIAPIIRLILEGSGLIQRPRAMRHRKGTKLHWRH